MKVIITVVVEPDGQNDFKSEYRERFYVVGGTATTEEICANAQVATYNVVEELVERARATNTER